MKAKGLPAPKNDVWWLYVLLCDDKSFYIGVTNDLPRRWAEHSTGNGAEWTKKHKPLQIVHHEKFKSQEEAYNREKELKTGYGRKWLKREYEKGNLRQAGKAPKDDKWKKKYIEPWSPESNELPDLPGTWKWVTLSQLIQHIQAGKSFKCNERPPRTGETGIVKVSAVTWGEFNENESKTITDRAKINRDYTIKVDDFLFSRSNTIELVGACVIVTSINKDLLLSDKILRFDFTLNMSEWVLSCLRASHGRAEIESLATGNQESMRNISQSNIQKIRIPLPPAQEQSQLLGVLAQQLTCIGQIELECEVNLKRAERLRQSILQKAFSGGLVAPDPSDEPASILLEKIKQSQQEQTQGKKSTKTTKRRKMAKITAKSIREVVEQFPSDIFTFEQLREKVSTDYDSLKEMVFTLLGSDNPPFKQTFDKASKQVQFVRVKS